MSVKICAIHQPTFFPWRGYFDKIKRCDVFVFLDDVQFPKKGGTWSNRVAINVQGQSKWITAPINRPSGVWNINETIFQNANWRGKIVKTLQANYSKAPYYNEYKDFVIDLINFPSNNLSEFNINAIKRICELLKFDFKNKMIISSSFGLNSRSNELLIDLTKKVDCNTYMAGGGADSYQDISLFKEKNIEFIYQDFVQPKYYQQGENGFVPGLSIIDYLFNNGTEKY
jgi:hypothetical protein